MYVMRGPSIETFKTGICAGCVKPVCGKSNNPISTHRLRIIDFISVSSQSVEKESVINRDFSASAPLPSTSGREPTHTSEAPSVLLRPLPSALSL